MPVEFEIWRIDTDTQKISSVPLDSESRLEEILEEKIDILGLDLMVIGRQVPTPFGKRIDLLAINADGELVVIELKKDRTPREVAAQILDYASWIRDLSYEDITSLFEDYASNQRFEEAFSDVFGANPPEALNETHQLMIVASELDTSTERIVKYLSEDYGVPLNALFFRYFQDEDREYLARTWLIDPMEVEATTSRRKGKEPWNGRDFYVALGEGPHRTWEDCQKYGFVSGGQGKWYSRTLQQLFPGARIFVHIPNVGYVGVGTVTKPVKMAKDFKVQMDGRNVPLLETPLKAPKMDEHSDNPELSE